MAKIQIDDKFYHAIWYEIHSQAAKVNNLRTLRGYETYIRGLSQRFPCEKCRVHMNRYLEQFPIESARDPFEWSWRFHNAVNERLNKKQVDFETAKKLWFEGSAIEKCEKCSDEGGPNLGQSVQLR